MIVLHFFPSPAHAWEAKGHQIVALIAEAHLNSSTRDKIKAILPKNDTLAKASIWPDEVRKALPQMNPLHYVDVPMGATAYDRERDCPRRNCIVEAITWYVNVLKSNDRQEYGRLCRVVHARMDEDTQALTSTSRLIEDTVTIQFPEITPIMDSLRAYARDHGWRLIKRFARDPIIAEIYADLAASSSAGHRP